MFTPSGVVQSIVAAACPSVGTSQNAVYASCHKVLVVFIGVSSCAGGDCLDVLHEDRPASHGLHARLAMMTAVLVWTITAECGGGSECSCTAAATDLSLVILTATLAPRRHHGG